MPKRHAARTTQPTKILNRAVLGEDWRFGIYNRANRKVTQDQKRYQVPEDLLTLMKILTGIITQ
jgi:hypothetical protein